MCIKLKDGTYRVTYKDICAGFVIENGKLTQCAPILRKKMEFWKKIAKRIEMEKYIINTKKAAESLNDWVFKEGLIFDVTEKSWIVGNEEFIFEGEALELFSEISSNLRNVQNAINNVEKIQEEMGRDKILKDDLADVEFVPEDKINPEEDGITHINIYSKGKTELGRSLTNFARTPFICEDGEFESVEGYWYWIGSNDDELRKLYGFKAKEYGKQQSCIRIPNEEFQQKIKNAIKCKIEQNPNIQTLLKRNELSLLHYYNYGGKVVELPQYEWIPEYIETLKNVEFVPEETEVIKLPNGSEIHFEKSPDPEKKLQGIENPYENDLIFGKNKTEGVVAVEIQNDDVIMFLNDGTQKTIPNKYWFVSPRSGKNSERLDGNLHYKHLFTYDNYEEFNESKATLFKYKADFYTSFDDQEAAMIYNGITCFKGLKVEDVSVLSFDIEAKGLIDNETNEPIAGENAEVYIISNTFRNSDGKIERKLFSLDEHEDSVEMIEAWIGWVQQKDPSIICGHNVFGYDLPYLSYCYKKSNSIDLELGKDCSEIQYNKRTSKFRKDGSQSYDYVNAKIFGRQIIDTMFLSIKYDFKRNYPNYTLKGIIEHEGLTKKDRQFYEAGEIAKKWSDLEERKKIKKYCLDDADDSLALYDLMIPQFFYYAQSIPKPFQKINNSATGSQINSFLVRSYLQIGHSLPKHSEAEEYEGAISFGNPGVWQHVQKVDVASLYPSIMITKEVYDKVKDPNAHFLQMVKYFTNERLNNKKLGKETGDRYYKDVEQGQKIFINSAYGMLGASGLLFNSPKNAALVTRVGREILQKGIKWVEDKGYQVVNVDTDSFSYTTGQKLTDEGFKAHIDEINNLFDAGIKWEDDGRYKSVLVVKAKNYALKSYDKKQPIKIKGSALKATMKESALCEFITQVMNLLLDGKKDQLFQLYNHYAHEIIFPEIDISRWCSKKTVTKAVLNPERTNEERLLEAIKHKNLSEGSKFYVYFDRGGLVKHIDDYQQDHCPIILLKKLYNSLVIFNTVFDVSVFPNYSLKRNQKLLGLK